MKVLITDKIHQDSIDLLKQRGLEVMGNFDMHAMELEGEISGSRTG